MFRSKFIVFSIIVTEREILPRLLHTHFIYFLLQRLCDPLNEFE